MAERARLPWFLAIRWWWLLVASAVVQELYVAVFHYLCPGQQPLELGTWFITFWGLLQSGWLRSVDKRTTAVFWYGTAALIDVLFGAMEQYWHGAGRLHDVVTRSVFTASLVAGIVGILVMRRDMTRYFLETTGLDLDLKWSWSLLFSDLYFQYHFAQEYDAQVAEDARIAAR